MSTSPKPESHDPLFRPFAWDYRDLDVLDTLPAHVVRSSASTVRDLASGTAVVLEMVERNLLDAESAGADEAPLLSPFHQGVLMRLAIATMRMVEREAIELQELESRPPSPPTKAADMIPKKTKLRDPITAG